MKRRLPVSLSSARRFRLGGLGRLLVVCVVFVLVLAVPSAFAATGDTWTARTSAADNDWMGVTFANGLFVAVAESGTGDRVMTSADVPVPARAGYCSVKGNTTPAGVAIVPGTFLNLLFEQPATDTRYTAATIAIFVWGKGITCDPPPVGHTLQGKATQADHVAADLYPYYKP